MADVVQVRGGDNLREYLRRAADPRSAEELAREFVRVFPIGTVKARIPVHSGRMKRHTYIRQRGAAVELRSVFYGSLARFRNGKTLRDLFTDEAVDTLRRVGGIRP